MSDSLFTLSTGRKLAFSEFGDPQGAVIFYFHGWPSSRLQGELLDDTAKRYGLRVIAPDRPGIGLSEFHPGRSIADWPALMTDLASHVNAEKFFVIGVSGGGPYALVCAQTMPQRPPSRSWRITSCSS